MISMLVLSFVVASAPPTAVALGQPAPFAGVLIPPERAAQLIEEEAQLIALQKQLEAEKRVVDAVDAFWRAKYLAEVQRENEWYNDPEVNRWGGFAVGFLAGLGVLYGGAYVASTVHP